MLSQQFLLLLRTLKTMLSRTNMWKICIIKHEYYNNVFLFFLKCISQKSLKMGYCQTPNLRDFFVHSRITYSPSTNTGTHSLPIPNKVCSKTDQLLSTTGQKWYLLQLHHHPQIHCTLQDLSQIK